MSTMTNDLIRGYYDLHAGTLTYDELAEHYSHSLPENAREWRSWEEMRGAVVNSGSHFFDRDAIRFFLARSDKRLFGRRFWVESKQFEDSNGDRDPRTYSVAWVAAGEAGEQLSIERWGEFDNLPAARGWAKRFAEAVTDTES